LAKLKRRFKTLVVERFTVAGDISGAPLPPLMGWPRRHASAYRAQADIIKSKKKKTKKAR